MSRPIPLAIISFLLGVFTVVMFVAPRYYTIEDAVYSKPEYAQQIVVEAAIAGTPSSSAAVQGEAAALTPRLVVRLKNTGELTVWGKIECRVSGFSGPIVVPVPILPPAMDDFAVYSIPLDGAVPPEEGDWQVQARWGKLYGQ